MPLREMDREQAWLLPPTLDELVPADHPARFVAEFVDALSRDDWTELGVQPDGEVLGAPAYHQLYKVWNNCASVCREGARMVIRFGQLPHRNVDAFEILQDSLSGTPWRIQTRCQAGSASKGRRQADHFGIVSAPKKEFDLWAVKT